MTLKKEVKEKISETASLLRTSGTSRLPQEILENELEATTRRLSDPAKLGDFEYQHCLPNHCNIQPEYYYARNGWNKVPCSCGCGYKYSKGTMIHFRNRHYRMDCALDLVLKEAQQFQKFQAEVSHDSLTRTIDKLEQSNLALAKKNSELLETQKLALDVADLLGDRSWSPIPPDRTKEVTALWSLDKDPMKIAELRAGDLLLLGRKKK